MKLTPAVVEAERDWIRERGEVVVPLINDVRAELADAFDTEVESVDAADYEAAVDAVFADGDLAVNVAALTRLLRDLDVADDYPGFVVDEVLGRELAATVAGGRPLSLLAEATFHVADLHVNRDATANGEGRGVGTAGADDLDAALAAGFQTRLPGWDWREGESPFAVDADGFKE